LPRDLKYNKIDEAIISPLIPAQQKQKTSCLSGLITARTRGARRSRVRAQRAGRIHFARERASPTGCGAEPHVSLLTFRRDAGSDLQYVNNTGMENIFMSIRKLTGEMLIRPCDAMYVILDGDNYANVMQMPQGTEQGNEFGDTIYKLNGFVPYHEHNKGYETFLCSGPVETFINGKRFITEKGDLIHIQPYTNHLFRHLHEGSVWREIFQGVHMYHAMAFEEFMNMYSPGINKDEEFTARRRMKYSGSFFWNEEPLVENVTRYDVPECKPHDRAFASYEFPGVTLNLKVGRWEHGNKRDLGTRR